ncbi:MAG: hypothetical protein P0111_04630 [Nitrospira sp.]|nr:hypothetical protein [Nitrospira sp.]
MKAKFRTEYKALRQDIIDNSDADIYHALPEAVRLYLDISDFWGYVKKKLPHTARERTNFLHKEFKPVLLRLDRPAGKLIDPVPEFAPLAFDDKMKEILNRRWRECQVCAQAGAHLAAIVMMGGLLENLFVARQGALKDKTSLIAGGGTKGSGVFSRRPVSL